MPSSVRLLALVWMLVWASVACVGSAPVRAQDPDDEPDASATAAPSKAGGGPRFHDLAVGFGKRYKLGCWTPVRVTIDSGLPAGAPPLPAQLQLETTDGDGAANVYTSAPLQLTGGRGTTVTMYVRFGGYAPTMKLSLVVGGNAVMEETVDCREGIRRGFEMPMSADSKLILCIGRSTAVDDVAGSAGVADVDAVRIGKVEELPNKALGYDGVDAVVLAADDSEIYASFTADGPQVAALAEWLRLGGRITIVAGNNAKLLLGSPPFQRITPIAVGESVTLPSTAALEEYADGKPIARVPSADRVTVFRSKSSGDVVEIEEGDLPLLVRRPVGLGILTISFVDLEHLQLRDWPGRTTLLAKAMRLGSVRGDDPVNSMPPSYRSYGYNDLSGQLRSALDQYEGVAVISFFVLAILILFYIAMIGPFDYLIVRNVFRRTEMTWFTFPVIVIVTSAGAYFAAVWMKGDELRVSQVDVVDLDVASGVVRGTTFSGVFSPTSDTYELSIQPPKELSASEFTPGRSTTSWLGLSGDGFGAMHGPGGGGSLFTSRYYVSEDLESLANVPIQVWSSKMFLSRWDGRGKFSSAGEMSFGPLRELPDGSLAGTIANPLKVPLKGALLCYDTTAYRLPNFEVGKSYDAARLDPHDLSSELQQAEVIKASKATTNPSVRTHPHDPGSNDVNKIVREMMFYDAAGGYEHAKLDNHYHGFLDLSELLKVRRAVLVGYIDSASDDGADLNLTSGGEAVARRDDRRWVFVRIVLPVEQPSVP